MPWFVGLDLAQVSDYSAISILEQTLVSGAKHFAIRHLQRWQNVSYPSIVTDVLTMVNKLPPTNPPPVLCIDNTGVGRPVVDMFRAKRDRLNAAIIPINITGGFKAHPDADPLNGLSWNVPKKDLVGVMQVLMGTRQIECGPSPHRAILLKELTTFKMKTDRVTGNMEFSAWRERDHDDMVLSVSLACWYALRGTLKQSLGQFRIMHDRPAPPKKFILRFVLCNRAELAKLEIDHDCLLADVADPDNGDESNPPHALTRLLTPPVRLRFLASEPDEFRDCWGKRLEPWGKTPDELVMNQTHGKQLWSLLTKRRTPPAEVVVIADDDQDRALSLAMAIVGVLGEANATIVFAGDLERKVGKDDKPPRRHVFEVAKRSRGMVL